MEIMNFTIDSNINFLLMVSFFLIFLVMVINNYMIGQRGALSIPPGPYQWPVIGNFLQVGKNPQIKFRNMARTYGPIMSVKLGARLVIVGSSPKAAMEILKAHDFDLSGRHVSCTHPSSSPRFNKYAVGFAKECNDQWKQLRTICRAGLFKARSIQGQVKIRERNVENMVKYLHARTGHVVDMSDLIFNVVLNTMANILFSSDVFGFDINEPGPALEIKRLLGKFVDLLASLNIGDLFPILHGLDIQGLNNKARKIFNKLFEIWEQVLKERREMRSRGMISIHENDFLDILVDNGFTDEHINHLMLELLLAGTDTTSTTIVWTLAELVKNTHAMHKLREEIKTRIGDKTINESDAMNLPYLQACVKETLRLHPPVPFLLPRRATKACKMMNYAIPKDSQVIVNIWGLGRDPSIWEDPWSFTPERFIGSSLDFKGNDFEFIPFGSGRRMCPGMPMASCQIPYVVASLVRSFDWCLPGFKPSSELDMEEVYIMSIRKKQPLELIPKVWEVSIDEIKEG